MTALEIKLLRYFIEHEGTLLPRQRILDAVWGSDYFGTDRTVDNFVNRLRAKLEAGELEDRMVELSIEQKATPVQIFSNLGMENMDVDLQGMFDKMMPKNAQPRQLSVKDARKVLLEQETEALIDRTAVVEQAV